MAIAGYFHMVGSGRAEVFVARDIEKANFDNPAGLPLLLGVIPIILGLLALLLIVIR